MPPFAVWESDDRTFLLIMAALGIMLIVGLIGAGIAELIYWWRNK